MSILWIFTYYKETSTKPIKQATLKVFNMILYEYLLVCLLYTSDAADE